MLRQRWDVVIVRMNTASETIKMKYFTKAMRNLVKEGI